MMGRYLVVSDETDSVVIAHNNLKTAVESAAKLGYGSGYVTNQDGGRGDLRELIERYGFGSYFEEEAPPA